MKQIVKIKQKLSFAEQANAQDPAVAEYHASKFTGIGSFHKGKNPGSGLTRQERNIVMEEILDLDNTDRDFKAACTLYFHEMFTKVPAEGIQLRVDLQDPTKPLAKDNLPVDPKDYVVWKHALAHPQVGINKDEADETYIMRFYIVDEERDLNMAVALEELADQANILYLENKTSVLKAKQVLTLLGQDIKGLNDKEIQLKFKKASEKSLTGEDSNKKLALERFINVCKDKDLEMKYLIERMVGAQILEKVGTRIVLAESGDEIGVDMKETILFLKDPTNSQTWNMLQARFKEFVKDSQAIKTSKEVEDNIVE